MRAQLQVIKVELRQRWHDLLAEIRDALSSIDLQVRAGVHTGEIELRGDNISGIRAC